MFPHQTRSPEDNWDQVTDGLGVATVKIHFLGEQPWHMKGFAEWDFRGRPEKEADCI